MKILCIYIIKTRTNVLYHYHATARGFKMRSLVSINSLPPTKQGIELIVQTKNVTVVSKDGSINDTNKKWG
jgi:hypothetical protein